MSQQSVASDTAPVGALSPSVPARETRRLLPLWSAAIAVAVLSLELLYDRRPGLGWPLWTAASAVWMAVFGVYAHGRLTGPRVVPLVAAFLVSACAAVTASEGFQALAAPLTASLLALSMLISADATLERVTLRTLLWTPIVAPARAALEFVRRVGATIDVAGRRSSAPVMRGLAVTVPVVIVFALLLSGADPVFAAARDVVRDVVLRGVEIPKVIFFCVILVLASGAYGVALAGVPVRLPGPAFAAESGGWRLGTTERRMLLGAVAGLFGLFLVLQLGYLFGSAPAVAGSGVTFAEFARRGFGELAVAAALCAAIVLLLELGAKPDRVTRIMEHVLLGELLLLLASAFRRVLLYEAAYGYTVARVLAQTIMVGLALAICVLAWEIRRGLDFGRLTRAAAAIVLGGFVGLSMWNHQAWIARHNLARYERTGVFDARYHTQLLSADAIPTLVAALPRLAAPDAERVRACLTLHAEHELLADGAGTSRWTEWHPRRAAAGRALAGAGITPQRGDWSAPPLKALADVCSHDPAKPKVMAL